MGLIHFMLTRVEHETIYNAGAWSIYYMCNSHMVVFTYFISGLSYSSLSSHLSWCCWQQYHLQLVPYWSDLYASHLHHQDSSYWRYLFFFWISSCTIGINFVFLCINICWTQRVVLIPEPERRGIYRPQRGLADLSVSEKHVWSLLLYKVILSLENFRKH